MKNELEYVVESQKREIEQLKKELKRCQCLKINIPQDGKFYLDNDKFLQTSRKYIVSQFKESNS